MNLTLQTVEETVIPTSALAVIVVPVYGGHVAPLAMERLENIRGLDTPTVLVVVYGNRAYEKALMRRRQGCMILLSRLCFPSVSRNRNYLRLSYRLSPVWSFRLYESGYLSVHLSAMLCVRRSRVPIGVPFG